MQSKPVSAPMPLQSWPSDCILFWATSKVPFPGPGAQPANDPLTAAPQFQTTASWLTPGQWMDSSPRSPCAASNAASIHPIASPIIFYFLSPNFSPQPYFSFHKPRPPRIVIRCHQQAHGDGLQNNPLGPQTLLRSLLHYEPFWPRWRRLLFNPSIHDFQRLCSRICGLLRIFAHFFIL